MRALDGGRRLRALTVAVLMCGVGDRLSAAEPAPPYQFGIAVGTHLYSSASGLGRYANDGPDNAPLLVAPLVATRLSRRVWRNWSVEGEVGLIPTRTRDADASLWVGTLGLRALRTFAARRGFIPFITGGISAAAARSSDAVVVESDVDGAFHAGAGVLKPLGAEVFLRLEARLYWSPALGLVRNPAREDVAVPPEPEILVGLAVPFGRESGRATWDEDGDRLLDEDDLCPRDPGPYEGHGCPDVDSDGDRIVDRTDACPAEPEDRDQFQDDDGCADVDDDGDSFPDTTDRCPRAPETANGFEDSDGCPDEVPPAVKDFTGIIKGIFFAEDSAVIAAPSFETLNEAARVLREFPAIRLEISGHTDSTGSHDYNMTLSTARAAAVKTYLVARGTEASRLRVVGLGAERPISTNDTEAGRARNRRIEFRLIVPHE